MILKICIIFLWFSSNKCDEFSGEFELCEENNTCSTHEDILNTTESTLVFPTESNNNTEITNTTNKDYESDSENCLCDLERKYCDINCCCDQDCTTKQKLIFSSCETGLPNVYDPQYCYSNEYIYVNGSLTSMEKVNKELFCILRSNIPPSFLIQLQKPIGSISEAQKFIKYSKNWPDVQYTENIFFNVTDVLKKRNTLWIRYNNSSKIVPFYLPKSVFTNVCLNKEPVKFLDDFKSTCSHMINEDVSEALFAETYFDFKLIAFNSSLNYTVLQNLTKDCPRNICIPIDINLCDENFLSCENIFPNDTRLQHNCQFSLYSGEQVCTQIVKKVKYIFYHNGTQGFTQINLYLNLTNTTFYITENEQFEQSFQVNFYWHDYKNNLVYLKSGNPGYLIGKPILISNVNCSTLNKTDDKKFEFVISQRAIDNFLILPENVNGYCKINNDTYKIVQFGLNIKFSCKENILFKNINNNICFDIQKQVFNNWEIFMKNNESFKYVAVFGNPNRRNKEDWIEIMYNFNLNDTFEKISADIFDDKIICKNLMNTLKINILYAYVDFEKTKNQRKILNIFYELKTRNDLYFDVGESLDFKMNTEIMFYDITGPKLRKFADPPSFEIKVPNDFFYPFMSGARGRIINYILFVVIVFIFL